MDDAKRNRKAAPKAVAPTDPEARDQVVAAQLAQEKADQLDALPAANGEGAEPAQPPVQLRSVDEIASDVSAIANCGLGLVRFIFSRGNAGRAQRWSAAHRDLDPRNAGKAGKGLAKLIVRKQAGTADTVVEWVSLAADLVNEFVTEALAETIATKAQQTASVHSIDKAAGQ